jgi:protein TonB
VGGEAAHETAHITSHPGALRAASFMGAAALLAFGATMLVTMKISWTAERSDDPPIVTSWSEPAPPPHIQTPRQPPATHEPQGPTILSSDPNAQTQTQTATMETSFPVSHDIREPRWLSTPDARDFARFYPSRALDRGVSGRVLLDCIVGADGRIACSVGSETPPGQGFGEAALRIAQSFRMAPQTIDGSPTDGGHVRVPITFRAE